MQCSEAVCSSSRGMPVTDKSSAHAYRRSSANRLVSVTGLLGSCGVQSAQFSIGSTRHSVSGSAANHALVRNSLSVLLLGRSAVVSVDNAFFTPPCLHVCSMQPAFVVCEISEGL